MKLLTLSVAAILLTGCDVQTTNTKSQGEHI